MRYLRSFFGKESNEVVHLPLHNESTRLLPNPVQVVVNEQPTPRETYKLNIQEEGTELTPAPRESVSLVSYENRKFDWGTFIVIFSFLESNDILAGCVAFQCYDYLKEKQLLGLMKSLQSAYRDAALFNEVPRIFPGQDKLFIRVVQNPVVACDADIMRLLTPPALNGQVLDSLRTHKNNEIFQKLINARVSQFFLNRRMIFSLVALAGLLVTLYFLSSNKTVVNQTIAMGFNGTAVLDPISFNFAAVNGVCLASCEKLLGLTVNEREDWGWDAVNWNCGSLFLGYAAALWAIQAFTRSFFRNCSSDFCDDSFWNAWNEAYSALGEKIIDACTNPASVINKTLYSNASAPVSAKLNPIIFDSGDAVLNMLNFTLQNSNPISVSVVESTHLRLLLEIAAGMFIVFLAIAAFLSSKSSYFVANSFEDKDLNKLPYFLARFKYGKERQIAAQHAPVLPTQANVEQVELRIK
ncbi:MAG: hypothetical protein A3E82_06955 [Gammaproteobacteria bacterium RIFCSPHIGHO2_12_FULL_38_11]|nr:MAG: hypothetical protein A3E82_06955 [Gammaproteobacteria bacterium RIFCSPHIGHO2_12_FULL_38_11]